MSRGLRVLFVCSRNQWRSLTAERVYAKRPGIEVRSAGTSANAKRRLKAQDIEWADLIFVMEHEHKKRLRELFEGIMDRDRVFVLDIPDEYKAMDPELIDLITTAVDRILTFHQTRGNAP